MSISRLSYASAHRVDMSHAQVDEVSDSDSDPSIDDPSAYALDPSSSIISPSNIPSTATTSHSRPPPMRPQTQPMQPRPEVKTHTTLYPIYFSSRHTRSSGRRVPSSLAVPNPLAHTVALAAQSLSTPQHPLTITFEPHKTHPNDWSNPGRVRLLLYRPGTHTPVSPNIKNKRHLFRLVATYLKSHPTEPDDPLKLRIRGMPNLVPEKGEPWKNIARPRGWRMNEVLPLHSSAVSGGGVSENYFKDMMNEMAAEQQLMQGKAGDAGDQGAGGGLQGLMDGIMGGAGPAGSAGQGGEDGGAGSGKKKRKKG